MVAVTFDDGFDLMGSGAKEVLDAHGVKATTFVLTAMVDNRGLMWRNKLSAICALRPPDAYVRAYNRVTAQVGAAAIREASELLGAAWHWDMARKDELADELWRACDMPPLAEYLDEHRPYLTREQLATWLADGHSVGLHTDTPTAWTRRSSSRRGACAPSSASRRCTSPIRSDAAAGRSSSHCWSATGCWRALLGFAASR